MSIYKVETYVDDFNRSVIVRTSINSDEVSYIGSVIIKTSNGTFPIEFEFTDKELTLEKCFEVFDETLRAFVEAKQQEARTKIVTPQDIAGSDNVIQFPKG